YGNELSSEGIDRARRLYGIELSPKVLEEEDRDGFFDGVTMWGVLEHVPEPMSLLQSAFRVLRDGGILFLYTPTWCLYDSIGLRLAQVSRNRWTVLIDRRISEEHLQIYPMRSLRAACERIGFEMIMEEAVSEYNFKTAAYIESMGVPAALRKSMALAIDGLIDAGLFFKNNARIYCRKVIGRVKGAS
ncbi:MAG: class I SAM-dependent methyltransferase, partial [Spirochaetes bacterium]|nr:class I SAM-dependent methyltransferase [Spirochaetota bacterium]